MIPHIIHYCWFGGAQLPELAERCIATWHRHMPDWTYMRWDESNFSIADAPSYVRDAYAARKFAFVSDYVRLWALEQYGGLYMDVDFEVFRPFDDLMNQYAAYAGYEGSKRQPVMQGVLASEPHGAWVQDMLATYAERSFHKSEGAFDMTPNTSFFSDRLEAQGFVPDGMEKDIYVDGVFFLHVFPVWFFCPILTTGEDVHTEQTYCIHRGLNSWSENDSWKAVFLSVFSPQWRTNIIKVKRYFSHFLSDNNKSLPRIERKQRIPHIIHYCWFGNAPLPELMEKCIATWHQHMPDWTFMRWDETNFNVQSAPIYVRQAYEARKFAFVSDYVRLMALEKFGGVYLDTDVEVLRSLEPLLSDVAFMGMEESNAHLPGTCVLGCEPHCRWVKDMISLYDNLSFIREDGTFDLTTNVQRMGGRMLKEGLNAPNGAQKRPWKTIQYINIWGLRVYTYDYFSPITSTRVMRRTANTYTIHYLLASWMDRQETSGWRDWTITREIINLLVLLKRRLFH